MNFNSKKHRLLIVDDDRMALELLEEYLGERYETDVAENGQKALDKIAEKDYHMLLTDLIMPGMDGLELIKKIREKGNDLPVFVISGSATVMTAVKAMKLGAEEIILKPLTDLELVHRMVERSLKQRWLEKENQRLEKLLAENDKKPKVLGNSRIFRQACEMVEKIAPLDTTVLLTGETGAGKSIFAEIIHNKSNRKNKKFVSINCGTLSDNLLESTLFGHRRGAFTGAVRDKKGLFEEADGGTLFLDEISETSQAFQIKLLHVIEKQKIRKVGDEKEINVDVRLIFATNRNLKDAVENGSFRQDLYFRINVLNIRIPALRERKEDILLIARAFVREYCRLNKLPDKEFSDAAKSLLINYSWEGNVRELRNAVEYAVVMCDGDKITPENLPESLCKINQVDKNMDFYHKELDYRKAKKLFEKSYFTALLRECKGNVSLMATRCKLARQFIYRKLDSLRMKPEDFRPNNSQVRKQ